MIRQREDGKSNFECDEPRCGFVSAGWDNAEQATARGDQHTNEHKTGELMQELVEFEQSVGFNRNGG
jgi:hypothetical protein